MSKSGSRFLLFLGILLSVSGGYISLRNHTPITDPYTLRGVPENLGSGILHRDEDEDDDDNNRSDDN